jgi:hypothetical protein
MLEWLTDESVVRPRKADEYLVSWRVMLQYPEGGTLQNQMFSNPQSITHKFMWGIVGAFLKRPP